MTIMMILDTRPTVYVDPKKQALLNEDVHQIPGSPWAKPAFRGTRSNRPTEPLAVAKYASTIAFGLTIGWVGNLLLSSIWNYTSRGGNVFGGLVLSWFVLEFVLLCQFHLQMFHRQKGISNQYQVLVPSFPKPRFCMAASHGHTFLGLGASDT